MPVTLPSHLLLAVESAEGDALGVDILALLGVLATAWIAGRIATRVGYPSILGELIGGIIAGPAVLGWLYAGQGLDAIGELGIILMMLYIGIEIDLDDLKRASWPGLLAAAGGFLVPFVLGYGVVLAATGSHLAGVFVGIAVGVTSLATKSRILIDLDLLDTRIAHVLMAAALLSDTATLIVFAAIIGFVEVGGFDIAGTAQVAGEALAFFAVTGLIGWFVFPRIGRALHRARVADRAIAFAVIVGLGLLFAEIAEIAGLHAILGAFVAGLFVREDMLPRRVERGATELLESVSIGFLAPVFFVTAGFQIDLGVFRTDLALLLAIVGVAVVGKIVGTMLFYLPSGHGWREGLTVGAAMNGRGAVEIIVAGIGLERGLISQEIFTILVFMAIATTATVPVLLTAGTRWLRSRGELARSEQRRRSVLVIGAGPLGREVASVLDGWRPVRLIDANGRHVRDARARGYEAVEGDALDEEVLEEARAGESGVLLALTSNTEVNLLAAQMAREEFGIPRVAIATPSTQSLSAVAVRAGVAPWMDHAVDTELWDSAIVAGHASTEWIEISGAEMGSAFDRMLRSDARHLPLALHRGETRQLYPASGELLAGDRVAVLTTDRDHLLASSQRGPEPETAGV